MTSWEKLRNVIKNSGYRLDIVFHNNRWHVTLRDKIFLEGMYFGMGDTLDSATDALLRVLPKALPLGEVSNG